MNRTIVASGTIGDGGLDIPVGADASRRRRYRGWPMGRQAGPIVQTTKRRVFQGYFDKRIFDSWKDQAHFCLHRGCHYGKLISSD